jgi:hypothetical protein
MRNVLWLVPLVLTLENSVFVFIQCICKFHFIKKLTAIISCIELNGLYQWRSSVLPVQRDLDFLNTGLKRS